MCLNCDSIIRQMLNSISFSVLGFIRLLPFFKECFSIDVILSHRCCLPCKICTLPIKIKIFQKVSIWHTFLLTEAILTMICIIGSIASVNKNATYRKKKKIRNATYRRIWLEQIGVVFIPSSYEQWNPERTYSTKDKGKGKILMSVVQKNTWLDMWKVKTACRGAWLYSPRLCVFLHYRCHPLDKLTCGNWLLVNQVVLLC